jgi:hypothetical protein
LVPAVPSPPEPPAPAALAAAPTVMVNVDANAMAS